MSKVFVSIIIPTYNDWARLKQCLDSLVRQTYSSDFFEVIIVNNSKENPARSLSLRPNFRMVAEHKVGSYAARNKGISIARGRLFGFTDSDCIPEVDWIEKAVEVLETNSGCSRVGGPIMLFASNQKPTIPEQYELLYGFPQQEYVAEKNYAATANMFAYKHVFEKVGLFNSNMLSGGDQEWGRRAHEDGENICFSEDIVVRHPARKTIGQLASKARRLASGHAILRKKLKTRNLSLLFMALRMIIPSPRYFSRPKIAESGLPASKKFAIFILDIYLKIIHEYEILLRSDIFFKKKTRTNEGDLPRFKDSE